MIYDIIGDIHGCAQSLKILLQKLGYKSVHGVYQQKAHKVIFLGDFIDRGPFQREVINIVRPMIDNGHALSVMGNHEFNAIAYSTFEQKSQSYLRVHDDKNTTQHEVFLKAFPFGSSEYYDVIEWFKTLPLWLEMDDLRVVHACWDFDFIQKLELLTENQLLNHDLLVASSDRESWQFQAIETLLKGKEIPLPNGQEFKDKDGNPRRHIRIRWWDSAAKTYHSAFIGPESARTHIPKDEIHGNHLIEYCHDEKPVFLGHYWLEGDLECLAKNVACLDYSVASKNGHGKLVAYRYNGERKLDNNHFVWIPRQET